MFDFRDVAAASKDEQIRAWAAEMAADTYSGSDVDDITLIARARAIEKYVKEGR